MAQGRCQHCDEVIEFSEEASGWTGDCPSCGEATLLTPDEPVIRIPETTRPPFPSRAGGVGPGTAEAASERPRTVADRIIENVERVILGKRAAIERVLVAFLAEGHVLLEDVPGVAKTMLARAVAHSIGVSFKRIQCTPDLLPNDVTGASVFNQKTFEFEFRAGPIFAQIVLADEINRTTPRTQSALLEAMGEGQVTVDGLRYPLDPPFFVIATQNPIDHEGTFPLPEAQLDRFLLRLSLGYPTFEEEEEMLTRLQLEHPIDALQAVTSVEEVRAFQQSVRQVHVDEKVKRYLLEVVGRTRESRELALGASPRASMALFRTTQSLAAMRGRDFVLPDDVKELAEPVLAHRMILRPESRLRHVTVAQVIEAILREVRAP